MTTHKDHAAVDREEVAWAGGLFEGEGSVFLSRRDRRLHTPQPSASLGMTDEDSVRRFAAAVGFGRVGGPYETTNGTKPYWKWAVVGLQYTQALVAMLWPWLGLRRRETSRRVLLEGRGTSRVEACRLREARKRQVSVHQ